MALAVDLSATSALPLSIGPASGRLRAGDGIVLPPPVVRRLADLQDVLAEPQVDPDADVRPCAYLYRDVRWHTDDGLLACCDLRYDVTVTLPTRHGAELAKTTGHYHNRAADGTGYPEVYEVLHGRAAFVLQWVDDPSAELPRVRAVWIAVCRPGERIAIPPDCGHVTVNIGDAPLVVANLVARAATNEYDSYQRARGAAVYLLAAVDAPHGFRIEPNPRFPDAPPARVMTGSRWPSSLPSRGPLSAQFRAEPATFRFLTHPATAATSLLAPWTGG